MIVKPQRPFTITPPLESVSTQRGVERYEVHMDFEVTGVDRTELLKRIGIVRRIMETGS